MTMNCSDGFFFTYMNKITLLHIPFVFYHTVLFLFWVDTLWLWLAVREVARGSQHFGKTQGFILSFQGGFQSWWSSMQIKMSFSPIHVEQMFSYKQEKYKAGRK